MTPEQKQQRIGRIREQRAKEYGHSFTGTRGTDAMMADIDFLLSLVKSQEAEIDGKQQVIGELIIAAKGWEDEAARERTWCESCRRAHPVPQNAAHRKELQCDGVWYFADSSRGHEAREIAESVIAKWSEYANPTEALEVVVHNEQEHAAASMRSACVEKVKALRDEWNAEAQDPRADLKNLIGVRARAKVDAANEAIIELETLSIEKPKE